MSWAVEGRSSQGSSPASHNGGQAARKGAAGLRRTIILADTDDDTGAVTPDAGEG